MRVDMPYLGVGKYKIKYDLGIHKKPGLSCDRLQKCFKAGECVEVEKVRYLKYSIWGQTKEGWILMYMNATFYISEVKKKSIK